MAPWFERGAVHIPWGDAYSQRKMRQLVEELEQYPGRTTDTVMAFWFAWRKLQEFAPKYGSINRLKTEAPVWNRRLSRRMIRNPAYLQGAA
jgi:phage-related protein